MEDPDTKMRSATYHGSFFGDVSGYGKTVWAVVGTLDIDLEKIKTEKSLSELQVVDACINYLNTAPPRKKYAKRAPKPLYGSLQLYKYFVKEGPSTNGVQVILLTDMKKSKHFWREGYKR